MERKYLMFLLSFILIVFLIPPISSTSQPPVVTDTLYVGTIAWGPRRADPVRAYDTANTELLFNVYDTLIITGKSVGGYDVKEQHWEFSPSLATNVPSREEVVMVVLDAGINATDPECYWFQPASISPPEFNVNPYYHIDGWVDSDADGTVSLSDVLYVGEYTESGNLTSIVTVRAWNVAEFVSDNHLTLKRFHYDFDIRTDPVITFWNASGGAVGTFDIGDVEYSFERGLVQDQYGSPMWMFYKPFFGQMNSDFWNTGDSADAWALTYLIKDAIETVNATTVRFNLATAFPDIAWKEILTQTWSSILDKDWAIGKGCWNGDVLAVNVLNGYPLWWTQWRHIAMSPIQAVATGNYAGSGPYHVAVASQASNLVVLQRNPGYWRGWPALDRKAYLDTIDIEYIADWATRREAFKECRLDVAAVPRAFMRELLDPSDPALMTVGWDWPFVAHPEVKTIKNISPTLSLDAILYCFTLNSTSEAIFTGKFPDGIPPNFFNNTYVRKAFSYAFNRSRYLTDVLWGEATCRETPNINGLVPDYYGYGPDPPWTYDKNVTKVKQMLEQAMFTQDGQTKSVWDWGGFHLRIYNSGSDTGRLMVEYISETFRQVNAQYGKNFVVDAAGLDWATYLDWMETFRMPLFSIGWLADFADADNFIRPFMHSFGDFSFFQNYTIENGWTTTGPRTGLTKDLLIERAVRTPDGPDRESMIRDLDDIYIMDAPNMPTSQPLGRRWSKYWVKGWYYNALYPSQYYYKMYKEDTCWADVTGPTLGVPDGVCNMRDIGYIAAHFGAKAPDVARTPPYDPKWAPGNYGAGGPDVYGDRKIDMRDIGFACAHFCHTTRP